MKTITLANFKGESATVAGDAFESLKNGFRNPILQPGDNDYDSARAIWNGMIDRRPSLIVRCSSVSEIRRAVQFAREHGILTAIKGGGHNIAGNALCDGGMVIDLSGMKSVRIDPFARKAYVEPGATLGEFDREAQAFGLVTPLGINSTTGVAGLTLGGGFGWLSRKYGLTIDSLIGADVITTDNKFIHASETENTDLFWALRGGGGNFGIVTSFEFQLYEFGPNVLSGLIVYPLSEARSALKQYRDYVSGLSDDSDVWFVIRKAPPLPFIPTEFHGKEIIAFMLFHAGDPQTGMREFEPVRHFGEPIADSVAVQPYLTWQKAFDLSSAPGARNYWKSHNFNELTDKVIDTLMEYASILPDKMSQFIFARLGGAVNRVPVDSTAFGLRGENFVMNIHGRWDSPANDQKCIDWARSLYRDLAPYASGSVFMNFLTGDETDRVRAAYGSNYERLQAIKRKYDPTNLLSVNQNIRPE